MTRDRPFLSPVKCEIAIFFLMSRDFPGGGGGGGGGGYSHIWAI